QILTDIVLVTAALLLAFLIRFEASIPAADWDILRGTILAIIIVKIGTFYLSGLYERMWRYVSMKELNTLLRAVAISSLAIVILLFYIQRTGFPRSVIVIDALLTLLLVGGVRFGVRSIYEMRHHRSILSGSRPVLIFGAGDAGEIIVREMYKHPDMEYEPVGFVDDDPAKRGMRIHGIEVLGGRKDISDLAKRYEVEEVVIAIPSAPSKIIREAVSLCEEAGVRCKTLPGVFELLNGSINLSQIRDVRVEDLLGREPVKINLDEVASYLKDETVLVTGAGGSIGQELCRQITRFKPASIIALDQAGGGLDEVRAKLRKEFPDVNVVPLIVNIQDSSDVNFVFEKYHPTVVFHSAAHKHVPLMELNPVPAIKTNIFGTVDLAKIASRQGVKKFVFISSHKANNPTTVMGVSKRVAELFFRSWGKESGTCFVAVRFGNVFGSQGGVLSLFQEQIAKGGPVTVTHPDVSRYFMTTAEACQLVIQAAADGQNGAIYMLDMGEPVKIVDLARNLIKLSGFEPDVDIPVKFVGLRPGDEITEELVGKDEKLVRTDHQKVFVVQEKDLDGKQFLKDLDELRTLTVNHQLEAMDQKLRKMIPTYNPS
ncbi:MAG: nucleoside-diphosphate sugar epimerase/dehydratase, partial [Actinomycetota bacterium]